MMYDMDQAGEDCKDNDYGQKGKYHNYTIKEAARSLTNAEEIRDSAMMPYVKKCMEKDHAAAKKVISSIQDIRDVAHKNPNGEDED